MGFVLCLVQVPFVEQKFILGIQVLDNEVVVANLERDHDDIIVLLFVREDMEAATKLVDQCRPQHAGSEYYFGGCGRPYS